MLDSIFKNAKKESVFICTYLLKDKASQFLRGAHISTTNPSSLVYISNIKKRIQVPNTQWHRLNTITRLFYAFAYAEEQGFYAISIRFSNKLLEKMKKNEKPADFIRRRINENFKLTVGYLPLYAFILEQDKEKDIHLHGIMEIKDKEKTKNILKRTCFGKDYKESSFNKYLYNYKKVYSSGRWLAYCLKGKYAKNSELMSYISQDLRTLTKEQFNLIKGKKYSDR